MCDTCQNARVRAEITSVLENICAGLGNELGNAFNTHFGTDTDNWKEVDLLKTSRRNI